jgi:hypothetical protein
MEARRKESLVSGVQTEAGGLMPLFLVTCCETRMVTPISAPHYVLVEFATPRLEVYPVLLSLN